MCIRDRAQAQREVVRKTCEHIAAISGRGYEIAVVHGNGPQVGRIVMASEAAEDVTPAMPFDVCGAMSQAVSYTHLDVYKRQGSIIGTVLGEFALVANAAALIYFAYLIIARPGY